MKIDNKKTIYIGFAFLLIMMFWQVYDNIIAKILINSFGLNQFWSGVVMALDNVLAVFLLPLFGTLSDKTKAKMGKRKPYILVGTIIAAVLIMGLSIFDNQQLVKISEAGIPDVESIEIGEGDYTEGTYDVIVYDAVTKKEVVEKQELSDGDKVYLFKDKIYETKEYAADIRALDVKVITANNKQYFIGFISVLLLILLAMASFRTPAVSLMPDVTPKPLRSKANAIINLMGCAGGITALGFMSFLAVDYQSYTLTFVCLGVLMLIALAIFMIKVNEPKMVAEMQAVDNEPEEEIDTTEKTKMPKDVKKSFILILLSVVFWYMAYNAATSKFSVYASTVLDTGFTMPLMIAQGAAIVSYIPIGILSSKYGRKKLVIVGVLILLLAFLMGSFLTDKSALLVWVVMALAGIGWATINVNSYPMVVEMSKSSDIGKYTGIYYTASMIAQTVTPLLSGLLMDTFSMRWLFPYCVVFCVFAFITMLGVKHGNSQAIPEVKE